MAKLTLKKAATDVTVYLFAQDSSKTTGVGLTGLAYNTASLTAYYVRPLGSASAITLATQTVTGAHSDGGFVEIDATNMPGVYRLDLPDAVCATGVPSAVVMLKGATNLAPIVLEIQLTDFDLNDASPNVTVADMANDSITAAALKTDAVTEIQNGLATPTNITAGTLTTVTNLTNLPTMPADWVTASGLKADAVTEIQSGLALEATLTAIKGGTWTAGDTIANINFAISLLDTALGTIDNFLDTEVAAILADTNEIQTELADGGRTDLLIDAIKAKTDVIPASPAEAGEYTAAIAAVQADLDNPDQYKADVSGLATANEYATDFTQVVELLYSIMGGEGWTDETLVTIQAAIDAIKAKSDQLVFTTPNKVDASATIDPTGLATSADLAVVDGNVDEIKAITDQMVFTVANKIDASATVDPTGIATSAELAALEEKVDAIKVKTDAFTTSSINYVSPISGSTITIWRGDTLSVDIADLGSLASYVSLDFTVKASEYQSDDDALIRIRKNASGLADGLLRLNKAAHTTGTDGSITITDAPTGDVTIMLKAGVTDDLVPGTYVYDIQLIEAAEVSTLTTGSLIVSADVTRLVA